MKTLLLAAFLLTLSSTLHPASADPIKRCFMVSFTFGTGYGSFVMTMTGAPAAKGPSYSQITAAVQQEATTLAITNSVTPIAVSPLACDAD